MSHVIKGAFTGFVAQDSKTGGDRSESRLQGIGMLMKLRGDLVHVGYT